MTTPYEPMSPVADWIPVHFSVIDYPTGQAEDIIERLTPEWAARFLLKNKGYRRVDNHLGPAGVFPDVNRKVGRLESDVWDAMPVPVGAEPTREVIFDLVGHLFLMLHMLDEQKPTDSEMMAMVQEAVNAKDFNSLVNGQAVPPADINDKVMDALRRNLAAQPLTPEHMAAIRTFLESWPEPKPERPEPLADWIVEKDGRLRALSDRAMTWVRESEEERSYNDGWEYLPDDLQKAIVMIANGHEVVSTPELRRETSQYLSEHGHDGG